MARGERDDGGLSHRTRLSGRRRIECREAQLPQPPVPSPDGNEAGFPLGMPFLSGGRQSRHLRKRRIARLMAFCLIVSALCVGAALIGGLFRIGNVVILGQVHYTAEELLAVANVGAGEELFALDEAGLAERMLEAFPYLKSIGVNRSLPGTVTITVTERIPEIALALRDGRAALMDEAFFVLEICDTVPDGVYLVSVGGDLDAIPGKTINLAPDVSRELAEAAKAIRSVPLPSAAKKLSMDDRYAVTLTLEDGTILSLHSTKNFETRLRAAEAALAGYRKPSELGHLSVDVSEKSVVTVSFRPENPGSGETGGEPLG